jgi:hypothetical protein
MITNDEIKLEDKPSNDKNNESPSWEEIELLLNFAEELKTEIDASYDKIFVLNCFQIVIILLFLFVIKPLFLANDSYLFSDLSWESIGLLVLLAIFGVFSEIYLRGKRRRIKSDSMALESIINLIRENSRFITSNLSSLQKIQLKIYTARFDIKISPLIPVHWIASLIKFFITASSH